MRTQVQSSLGSGPLEAQHLFFGFLCFVAYWFSVVRAAYTTMYDRYPFSVGHDFLFLSPGPSTTCCSDCFLVELVLRLGLNSHSHHPEGFPSTRSSLSAYFRRSAARDDSLVSSVMLSLLAFFTLALSAFVVAGAGVGDTHQIFPSAMGLLRISPQV